MRSTLNSQVKVTLGEPVHQSRGGGALNTLDSIANEPHHCLIMVQNRLFRNVALPDKEYKGVFGAFFDIPIHLRYHFYQHFFRLDVSKLFRVEVEIDLPKVLLHFCQSLLLCSFTG